MLSKYMYVPIFGRKDTCMRFREKNRERLGATYVEGMQLGEGEGGGSRG